MKIHSTSRIVVGAALAVTVLVGCATNGKTAPEQQANVAESAYAIKHPGGRHEVHSEILINASPTQVWAVLTDFQSYPKWSTGPQGVFGDFRDGGRVVAKFKVGETIIDFPHVIKMTPGVSFSWSDDIVIMPGIKDDHHFIVVDAGNGKSRFVQRDTFVGSGNLRTPDGKSIPMTAEGLASAQVPAYAAFNRELKSEVEKRYANK